MLAGFSGSLKAFIAKYQYRVRLLESVFLVELRSAQECFSAPARELYRRLLREISLCPDLLATIKVIRYQCPYDHWDYPVEPLLSMETMEVPMMSEEEVLKELNNNWQEIDKLRIKLPATLVAMSDGKPLFATDNIIYSCGIEKSRLLRIPSNNDYFPQDELERYTNAIIEAKGKPVTIRYKAPKINSDQLFERYVEARLVRLQYGELARLVKALNVPRPIN